MNREASALLCLLLAASSTVASAQVLVAVDESFGLPYAEMLVVDTPGVLDNDLLDGEAAFEFGATAEFVSGALEGDLILNPDGSFTYNPGPTFDGLDSFVYAVVSGSVSAQATVYFSACRGGPDVFTCWKEGAFLAMANDLGYYSQTESFEDDAVWGAARTPNTVPSVANLGVRWTSNYPVAPPVANPITTTNGGPRTGLWSIYDANHGYAEGTSEICDVDFPDTNCLYHDGVTGTVEPGASPLVGVGGYMEGTYPANMAIVINDTTLYPGGNISSYQFFGVVDTRPAGFTRFKFEEQAGKVGQKVLVWGDDFTFLTADPPAAVASPAASTRVFFAGAGPNPSSGSTTWRFTLASEMDVHLAVYNARGHLIRELANDRRGPGEHAFGWNGRDRVDRKVAAGTYFGRLSVGRGSGSEILVRKMVILH